MFHLWGSSSREELRKSLYIIRKRVASVWGIVFSFSIGNVCLFVFYYLFFYKLFCSQSFQGTRLFLIDIAKIWEICSFEDWHFFQFSRWFLQTFDFVVCGRCFVRILNETTCVMINSPSLFMI